MVTCDSTHFYGYECGYTANCLCKFATHFQRAIVLVRYPPRFFSRLKLLGLFLSDSNQLPQQGIDRSGVSSCEYRVGRMLANVDATSLPHAQEELVVNSIQTRVPDEP